MRTTSPATSSNRAGGTISTSRQSRRTTRPSPSAPGECTCAARATSFTLSARAARCSICSSARWAASNSPPSIQQEPIPAEGNLIKREWLRTYDQRPPEGRHTYHQLGHRGHHQQHQRLLGCARSGKCRSTIIICWISGGDRVEYPELRKMVIALAQKHRPATTLIEQAGLGLNLVQDLQRNTPVGMQRPIGIKPEGNKLDRMVAQSHLFESGSVYFPEDAPWMDDLLKELLGFPNTRHDDQVDSITQFLQWYSNSG